MSITKNKNSTCVVYRGKKVVGYLSRRDEERGLDSQLDKMGYSIVAL